jgi:Fe(3+) dicitrate transport protein
MNIIHPGCSLSLRALGLLLVALLTLIDSSPVLAVDDPVETEDGVESPDSDAKDPSGEDEPRPVVRDRLLVLGLSDDLLELPGSAHRIDKLELEEQGHSDVHRILRTIPGVNIQEEDGFGLRPNIGLRGTGVERSQKVTLLEDGVLIAPAPYSAPAAYYSPTAGRMEGFEVRKGSSSVRQGPMTTGGAINYLSTAIPAQPGGSAEVTGGSDGLLRGHLVLGGSGSRLGWMLEGFRLESDGFKQLDTGGPTGFELNDLLGKFRWSSSGNGGFYQALELKIGATEQTGHETYLGLTDEDFGRNPFRRYAGSEKDLLTSDHRQFRLTWLAQLSPSVDLTASLYDNEFSRNWYKLQSIGGTNVGSVLDAPEDFGRELGVLRGDLDSDGGELAVRANRRDYFSRGLQVVAGLNGSGAHELEIGVRYHQDEEDRFQEEDLFAMLGGRLIQTAAGDPGSQSNRVGSARALALFATDTFTLGRWRLTPGVRYEAIDLTRRDFGKSDPDRDGASLKVTDNRVTELIPGLGVSFLASETTALFVGVHKGFAPPAPGSNEEVMAEQSTNYEAGVRHQASRLRAEVVGFYNDYDNLLGTDTLSSGGEGTGDQFNGGASRVLGVEASLAYEVELKSGLAMPLRANYTLTRGEFLSSFETGFADWAPAVEQGDQIPYLPEGQGFVGVGLRGLDWSVGVDATYNGEMRTTAGQGASEATERIDSNVVLDAAVSYRFLGRYRAFARVRNLADEVYVAARRPAGLRPGLPRTLLVGLSLDF